MRKSEWWYDGSVRSEKDRVKKEDRREQKKVTYKEARVYLDEMSKYGSVLGLDTIRGLLRELGILRRV